jgi:hypothetical protein
MYLIKMENEPKKRGRKVGSKKNVNDVSKGPPKKRGRKPKKKIITNENPVFADDNLNMDDLIIKLNNDKTDNDDNLSLIIDDHEEVNFNNSDVNKVCWNCCHGFHNRIHGLPINYNLNVFHTIGDFCSVECMARYAVDNMQNDIYNILPFINLYNNKINKNNKVNIAPSRLLLNIFGGDMTIDEYRNNNVLYDVKLPIIIPTNYNINKYNFKNNYNNVSDLKLYRKNKTSNNNNNITKKLNID